MIRFKKLEHRFVQNIPHELESGILYVSVEYGIAVHSCCCGCGEHVVTPFSPTDWKMTYDGESVSLIPSIGNWQAACRSHYIIRQGRVIEASSWSQAQVEAEYQRDKAAKARFYGEKAATVHVQNPPGNGPETASTIPTRHAQRRGGFWTSVTSWIFGNSSDK